MARHPPHWLMQFLFDYALLIYALRHHTCIHTFACLHAYMCVCVYGEGGTEMSTLERISIFVNSHAQVSFYR